MRAADPFSAGVRAGLPVALGYFSVGVAAGVVERAAGLSLGEIALLSMLLYAGAAQFITAGMVAAGSSLLAIAATVFFINARLLLISFTLAPFFRRLPLWQSVLLGAQLTDSTFAVAAGGLGQSSQLDARWMAGLNLVAWVSWVAANVMGGVFGGLIAGSERLGLDFASPAMFVAILAPQLLGQKRLPAARAVAVVAGAVAVAAAFFIPGSWSIFGATLIAATVGVVLDRWKDRFKSARKSLPSFSRPPSSH
ncbi:MAG TPA: AzlC family ABC transporter permease [Bacillota bacterium]